MKCKNKIQEKQNKLKNTKTKIHFLANRFVLCSILKDLEAECETAKTKNKQQQQPAKQKTRKNTPQTKHTAKKQ